MKTFFLFFVFAFVFTCATNAQKYNFRRACGGALNYAAAGFSNGLHEDLHYKFDEFHQKFPKANPQYWDPTISWKNKYKNGDPLQGPRFWGSKTVFVAATDAKHKLSSTTRIGLVCGTTLITIGGKRPWWHYLLDFGISAAGFSGGFHFQQKFF